MKGIDIAKEYLGLQEVRDGKKIESFLKLESHHGDIDIDPAKISWCAAFVNATQRAVGGEGSGKLNALSFLNYGQSIEEENAEEGDIIVFVFPSDSPGHGHVTYFVKWNDESETVTCLGGNQDNQVKYSDYGQDYIKAIRRGV